VTIGSTTGSTFENRSTLIKTCQKFSGKTEAKQEGGIKVFHKVTLSFTPYPLCGIWKVMKFPYFLVGNAETQHLMHKVPE
jgi:hypothetical protein